MTYMRGFGKYDPNLSEQDKILFLKTHCTRCKMPIDVKYSSQIKIKEYKDGSKLENESATVNWCDSCKIDFHHRHEKEVSEGKQFVEDIWYDIVITETKKDGSRHERIGQTQFRLSVE